MGNKQITKNNVLLLGVDGAGKNTILNHIKGTNQVVPEEPKLIISKFKRLQIDDIHFISWNSYPPRQDVIEYYKVASAIIFVVDSTWENFFKYANDELKKLLEDEVLKDCPILIFAHKQDIEGALKPNEVIEKLGLTKEKLAESKRPLHIIGTSAITGEGIQEGLQWIRDKMGLNKD